MVEELTRRRSRNLPFQARRPVQIRPGSYICSLNRQKNKDRTALQAAGEARGSRG
jgi:hypothetical protein